RNLYKLISLAHLEHFQRRPVMPKSLINKNREGLIIGSACEAGELFQAVEDHKDWDELKRIASWYDFLEIQPLCNNAFLVEKGLARDEEDLREFNRTIVRLGKELNKPVCATGDVHFLDPEQEIFRHILLAANGYDSADEELPIYFKTTDEMLEEFSYLGAEDCKKVVVDDPNRIAKWCDKINPLPKGLFAPTLKDSDKELEYLVYHKAHELYGDELPKIVQDRINLELPGIIQRKYDVIYMSAQKLVQNSLEHGYLVGSRGSVGSSIVAFLSGITEVNSLPPHYRCPKCKHSDFNVDTKEYGCGADLPDKNCPVCGTPMVKDGFNIPFETFLGYGGTKVPDIDLNFSGEYQARAHKYTFELFGEGHVFKAGTVGTVAEKTAYGYVLKYLEQRNMKVSRAEESRLALGCTNVKRTTGQHPGGMVVIPGDKEIYDFCPVQHPADDPHSDIVTTHFEYHSMESNLLKLDMLGHDDPTMIRMLQDLTGKDPTTIPLDDKDTMSIFCSSKVLGFEDDPVLGPTGSCGIPEFGTSFTRQMLIDTQPKNFNTLLRLSGFSHGTDVWLGNAKDLILSGTASVTDAIGCRDDIMLYLISMGCDELRSFKFMEAVRKGVIHKGKNWPEGIEAEMREHGIPEWYIESCRKIKYLFPKAHAVAYVMMAFRIAWFKVHEPLAFYAAYFSIRAKAVDATCMCLGMDTVKDKMKEIKGKENPTDVEEKMYTTLEMCYEFYLRGFTFAKMDLLQMQATRFGVDWEKKSLMPPFTSLPGLGDAAAEATVEQLKARNGQPFISVEEVAACCTKLSQTQLEQLKFMGAMDGLPETSQITLF
ncbi:MAG: PolC-type DNA polymerase III, partial [Clostridiales bacterium]|nr:PolC-type DNA polymerase III [Clostridiales bacterium]